jgi:8-oxo-dGTP pyrophosphatase MutT (NUDIX family)
MALRPSLGARVVCVSGSDVLPVDQYVARMNRKRMAAGVLFRDCGGRVLFVEPSYKPNWEIPGGAVEADESPWDAAAREIWGELGLNRQLGRLLVVDYVRPQDSRPEGVMFVFEGGVLEQSDVDKFVFSDGEILSAGFYSVSEIRERLKPLLANRVETALEAEVHRAATAAGRRRVGDQRREDVRVVDHHPHHDPAG